MRRVIRAGDAGMVPVTPTRRSGGVGAIISGAVAAGAPRVLGMIAAGHAQPALRALSRAGGALGATPRHPLAPAALRVERSRFRGRNPADLVAVTVWFGEGPSLPSASARGGAGRVVLRVGAGLLGAAAVAAATSAAARLQIEQQQAPARLAAPARPPEDTQAP